MSVPLAEWWCPWLGNVTGACGGCTDLIVKREARCAGRKCMAMNGIRTLNR